MDASKDVRALGFYETARYRLVLSLSLGGFMALFLIVFQPFGVSNYDPDHTISLEFVLAITTVGVAITLVSLLNEFALRPLVFRVATFRRVLGWSLWSCVLLSQVAFLVYNWQGDFHDWRLASAFEFLINCSTVFLFPLVGVFFWFRYTDLRQRLERVIRRVNAQPLAETTLRFEGQGSGDLLEVASSDFRFARAQDNYVELNYLNAGQVAQSLIRATLSALADQVGPPHAVRCHRSFLVNLGAVTAVRGPKSALRLHLDHVDEPIPVSRGFVGEIEDHL